MTCDYDNIAVGVDTEEIARFQKYNDDKGSPLLNRIYTKNELDYCFKTKFGAKKLAARFCAKEAVYKALCSFGTKVLNLKEIEVYHDTLGVPQIRLLNDLNDKFKIKVSLSHSRTIAIAQVVVCKVQTKKHSLKNFIFRRENSDGSSRFLIL